MEEITTTTMEQEQTSDSFLDGWDDTESYAEADQPEQQEEVEQEVSEADTEAEATAKEETALDDTAKEAAQDAPAVDAPKVWTLRHLDETKAVNEADMVVLAQKGMDYDRIRSKYDESRPVMELFGTFARRANMSIPDYVAHLRMQAKQADGMSEAEAKRTVDLEDREAAISAKEAEQQAQKGAEAAKADERNRRMAEIEEFRKAYPDAAKDPGSIPQEVWDRVNSGVNMVAAYAMYRERVAQEALAAAEQKAAAATQNQTNAARSTGSMRSSGDNFTAKDDFLSAFDAG